MEFINATYFSKGPRKIENSVPVQNQTIIEQAVKRTIGGYIESYEKDFLRLVLGPQLATEYAEYLAGETRDEAKENLLDQLRDAFADYVMYWFLRGQQTSSSTVGEKMLRSANDARSASERQILMWNNMVNRIVSFTGWCNTNHVDVCIDKSVLTKINSYGL